jgi:hypothetical protein
MRRASAVLLVLVGLAAFSLAVPAGADRVVAEIPVPGTGEALYEPGSLAMLPNGDFAYTWLQKGRIHLAWYREGRWISRTLDGVYGKRAYAGVAFSGKREPVVTWVDAKGVWVRMMGDTSAARLAASRNGYVAVTQTNNGRLLAVTGTGREKHTRIRVFVHAGGAWRIVERAFTSAGFDVSPWGRRGYALLLAGNQLRPTIETHATVGAKGMQYSINEESLGGSLAQLSGESLGVLYGGRLPGRTGKDLRFAVLRNGHLRSRVLIGGLQCDVGAIGIGRIGKQIRLAYGYGCDVGWRLNTLGGKVTYDPFRAPNSTDMSYPNGFASAGGRIAFAHRDVKHNRLSIRIIGPGH